MGRLDAIEIVFLLCFFALPAWGVIDAARLPAAAWRSAGRSKRFWILVQVLALYIGAVAYVAGVRRDVLFFTAARSPDWDEVEAGTEAGSEVESGGNVKLEGDAAGEVEAGE